MFASILISLSEVWAKSKYEQTFPVMQYSLKDAGYLHDMKNSK